ncbi:unnamed protein product [Somion occarium]|uniref:Uncharacterized protein n=1 Tax=Somion occarium TaxID=3059160 RepID=A0ABP1E9B3_9APHY
MRLEELYDDWFCRAKIAQQYHHDFEHFIWMLPWAVLCYEDNYRKKPPNPVGGYKLYHHIPFRWIMVCDKSRIPCQSRLSPQARALGRWRRARGVIASRYVYRPALLHSRAALCQTVGLSFPEDYPLTIPQLPNPKLDHNEDSDNTEYCLLE